MQVILFDDQTRYSLLPFTHTRPVADIRCGILTMRERWEKRLKTNIGILTESYLQNLFPLECTDSDILFINGAVFANDSLWMAINNLKHYQKLVYGNTILAFRTNELKISFENLDQATSTFDPVSYDLPIQMLRHVWDIFEMNEQAIKDDFQLVVAGRKSQPIPEFVTVVGTENVFLEEGAIINPGVVINAKNACVYLGAEAEILEGCLLRGSIALCGQAVLKMGTKLYGATTIGPGCKVGGEISNVVFFSNSNKGHDGYLGNAVIGSWCNLGADTNCSNLKNNYDVIKIWDEHQNKSVQTGLQFCGLMMGDHSKCGINTMFNTGTVVGVSANIFGAGFPEKFIPSFTWGGSEGLVTYQFERALDTAKRMMVRRKHTMTEKEISVLRHVFDHSTAQRRLFATSE
ncbi:MAG: GlmU family protein [Bacteroidetes bacterium]|nr:GlmU family protein [Bacteroidota bacterium]MBS1739244.1 GlmU family protein [Bacteroidota bacterium]